MVVSGESPSKHYHRHHVAEGQPPILCCSFFVLLVQALQTEGRATLSSLLRKPLSREAAAFYTATATLALEHIHHLGYIFRGLSPHTILLDIRGHIQLVDFRQARRALLLVFGGLYDLK